MKKILFFVDSLYFFLLFLIDFPLDEGLIDQVLIVVMLVLFLFSSIVLFRYRNYIVLMLYVANHIILFYILYNYYFYINIQPIGPYVFSVYTKENLHIASVILILTIGLIYFLIWLYSNKLLHQSYLRSQTIKKYILKYIMEVKNTTLIWLVMFSIAISVIAYFLSGTILQAPYPSNGAFALIDIPNTIRPLFVMPVLAVYMIHKIKTGFRMDKVSIFLKFLFLFLLYIDLLLIGPRGTATGLILILVIFDLTTDRGFSKFINLSIGIILLYVLFFLWPIIRAKIYYYGLMDALLLAHEYFISHIGNFNKSQFTTLPMIPQSMFHLLYVIDLIKNGISLDGQTFLNLIPQQMPGILEPLFGKRPLNDVWVLRQYFYHGGGFYVVAEAYWNGGIVPTLIFMTILTLFVIKIEIFFKNITKVEYYLAYPIFLILIGINILYGIQPMVRGFEYGIIVLFIIYIKTRKFKVA